MKWSVVYKRAYEPDGTLFFPQKLSQEFLDSAKRTMGSYLFANQYLNQIIPSELQSFKKEWFKYIDEYPQKLTTFIFIDPALSESDGADYTGIVVVSVDTKKDWYIRYAKRHRLSPTRLIDYIFELNAQYKPNGIGIEEVAYQKALLYFLSEEMRRRNVVLPVTGIKPPTDKTKQMRILSLVPRFEWNHIFLSRGLQDLELELLQFPRGTHDDIIDALAYVEQIAFSPDDKIKPIERPHSPHDPNYEKWYIQQRYGEVTNGYSDGET